MSAFLNLFFKTNGPKILKEFECLAGDHQKVQDGLLSEILRSNRESRFGKTHEFSGIASYEDFKRQVPVGSYESLRSYIRASIEGKRSQLTRETPCFYATTSGTTGDPKYIPVTPGSTAAKSRLMRVWISKAHADHPSMFRGKILTVVAPETEFTTPRGVACGAESGHGYRHMPGAIQAAHVCPYPVFTARNYEAKYYTLLRLAAEEDISIIYTVNPSTVVLLAERLGRYGESIIRDIHDGTLSEQFELPEGVRGEVYPRLKKNVERARFLEGVRARGGGRLLPRDVWPGLSLISCWKGGSAGMYLRKFRRYFDEKTPIRDIGYLSSEFRGSVPLSDEGSEGVLAVATNFYEFFPAGREREPEPRELLRSHELEKGRRYNIYVTTASGLYRYDMNDTVEVADFYHGAPVIRFIQKGKGIVSLTGEKLCESQVIEAVQTAFEGYSGNYEFIAAVGEEAGERARYAFMTEFEDGIVSEYGRRLACGIEEHLSRLNMEYRAKRESQRLEPTVLRVTQAGEFDRYRKMRSEAGGNDGQFKVLKLTSDRSFARNFRVEMDISSTGETFVYH